MSDLNKCDFGELLNTGFDKKRLRVGRKDFNSLSNEDQRAMLWRAGLLERKDNIKTIYFHHEQFFGKVFECKVNRC